MKYKDTPAKWIVDGIWGFTAFGALRWISLTRRHSIRAGYINPGGAAEFERKRAVIVRELKILNGFADGWVSTASKFYLGPIT